MEYFLRTEAIKVLVSTSIGKSWPFKADLSTYSGKVDEKKNINFIIVVSFIDVAINRGNPLFGSHNRSINFLYNHNAPSASV